MATEKKKGPGRPKGSKNKSSSKSSNSKRKEIEEIQRKRESTARLTDIIWGICYIALGALVFFAVQFHAAGEAGNIAGDMLKGMFGLLGLILPWYLIILGILMITRVFMHFSAKTLIISFILLCLLCLLNSGRFIDSENITFDMVQFYQDGITLDSGGFIGMTLGSVIVKFLGKSGLYIISAAGICISLLLILNTPMSKWLEKRRQIREETVLLQEAEAQKRYEDFKNRQEEEEEDEQDQLPEHSEYNPKSQKKESFLGHLFGFDDEDYEDDEQDSSPDDSQSTADTLPQFPDEPQIVNTNESEEEEKKKEEKASSFLKAISLFGNEEKEDDTTKLDADELMKEQSDDVTEDKQDKVKVTKRDIDATAKEINSNKAKKTIAYKKPKIDLLSKPERANNEGVNEELKRKAHVLDETLKNFGVDARVVQVTQGPAITRYEVQPNVGVKVSKIVSLADDIALNLEAKSIRIEAPIPGKAAVGIEVENSVVNTVTLREIISSKEFKNQKSKISFAVGKDIAGNPIVGNLKEMPHLLIAGATGSGKSVCINSIITSILYKADPDEVKLVLIDPKVVELGNYNGIPHLLIPVVTDPSKAAAALSWAVVEMTDRYKIFSEVGAKDLASFNSKMRAQGEEDQVLPQIVIIIDELADLMLVASKQVQETVQRIAQLGRAAGMHLIVATQRPSVDVITGVIKANIPARIAFAVSSGYDSKTILDQGGAEKLVGKGDMLYSPKGGVKPIRVQGTFVSEEDVNAVIDSIKEQVEENDYAQEVIDTINNGGSFDMGDDADELLPKAIECVIDAGQASVSMLQRYFRIGYNRSARIVDQMEERGIVGPQDGARPRKVLITKEEWQQMQNSQIDADDEDDDTDYDE
ncbi:MAG: DNA translocase FtsK 4TM domain-containing protein [Eubacterium sp.]|nr:DNA translocase FtsK 4TM domain-containing protein [Eubacterium sp.]